MISSDRRAHANAVGVTKSVVSFACTCFRENWNWKPSAVGVQLEKKAAKSPGVLDVHLEKLSAMIKLLEEEVRKSLIRGTFIPVVLFHWIEDAKQVEKQAKEVLLSQENNVMPRSLSSKIRYFVETSPVNDAGLINTREFQRGSKPLLKKEIYSQGIADRKQIPLKVVVKLNSKPRRPSRESSYNMVKPSGESSDHMAKPSGDSSDHMAKPSGESSDDMVRPSGETSDHMVKPSGETSDHMVRPSGETSDHMVKPSGESTQGGFLKLERLHEDSEKLLPVSSTDSMLGGKIATSELESKGRSIASDPEEEHHHTLEPSFAAVPQEIEIEELEMTQPNLTDQGQEDSDAQKQSGVTEIPHMTAQSSRGIGSPFSVTLSVRGELAQHMDLEFESLHGLSSGNRPRIENSEFKSCDFTSDLDDYHILVREKTGADQRIVSSSILPEHLILRKGGCKLTSPPEEEIWRQSSVMILRDNAFTSLPSQPDCPNLVLLLLQRNTCLRKIPDSFFSLMGAATFVDISGCIIRSLPSSLFSLYKLQVLKLRDSKCIARFPKDIGLMKGLEVLDLFGTELDNVPDEIQNLIHLRQLSLTFYGTGDESRNDDLSFFLSPDVISRLQSLEELSIDVHPEDERWRRNVGDVVRDLAKLNSLRCLDFYFPEVKLLEPFTKTSAWENIRCSKFKFVVGQNVKRIVDRVPHEVEIKFNEYSRSLRFVNGKKADEAINVVAEYATALYLDHHLDMCSLSEMGITTSEEIRFCSIRECPALKAIMDDDIGVPAYPRLEYLGMHFLWKLESLFGFSQAEGSFRCLKSLIVDTCPVLEFILSESMVPCLCNLEEMVVVNCGQVKTIVKKNDEKQVQDIPMFPRLAVLKLHFLPQLHSFWWNLGSDSVYPLPPGSFEAIRSAAVRSCPMLDLESLKSIKKDFEIVDLVENIVAFLDSPPADTDMVENTAALLDSPPADTAMVENNVALLDSPPADTDMVENTAALLDSPRASAAGEESEEIEKEVTVIGMNHCTNVDIKGQRANLEL